MKERTIQHSILDRVGGRSDIRIFRNNVGLGFTKTGTPIRFGLHTGSADIIGWKSVTITDKMVGRRMAIFVSIETKAQGRGPSPDQINWMQQVTAAGGLAGIARNCQDALEIVDNV
jgi:hypothetical protein